MTIHSSGDLGICIYVWYNIILLTRRFHVHIHKYNVHHATNLKYCVYNMYLYTYPKEIHLMTS